MSVLFSIYNPYPSNFFKTICELLLCIQMYPKKPITKEHIYDVYIINDVLYTHKPNKISKFIKNNTEYKIYADEYHKDVPILHVLIYEDEIQIKFTKLYNAIYTKNDNMDNILSKLENSYNKYKK